MSNDLDMAARAEAERRWEGYVVTGSRPEFFALFVEGALWQREQNEASRTPVVADREALIAEGRKEVAEDRRISALFKQQRNRDIMLHRADVTERLCDALAAAPVVGDVERIAAEIEVEMRKHDRAQVGFSAVGDAYAHAARIVRAAAPVLADADVIARVLTEHAAQRVLVYAKDSDPASILCKCGVEHSDLRRHQAERVAALLRG